MESNAPGQLLGYALQFPRALFHLLQCGPGEAVCVEVLGDVAKFSLDEITTEEDKSSLVANPLTNLSTDLWKTFSNWVNAVKNSHLTEATKFILYSNKKGRAGIVNQFNDATTSQMADDAIAFAKEKLKKISNTHPVWEYYSNCISNDAIFRKIIQNFELRLSEDGGVGFVEVRKEIEKKFVSPSQVEFFLENLSGWVQKEIMSKIYANEPAVITFEVFRTQFVPLFERVQKRELIDFTLQDLPGKEDLKAAIKIRPSYVRQLDKIGISEDEILESVADYMRAKVNRDKWIELELIDEDTAGDFEDRLHKFWKNQSNKNDIIYNSYSAEAKGKILLSECKSRSEPIRDMTPPSTTIAGTYHALADVPSLGWHPDWEAEFKK